MIVNNSSSSPKKQATDLQAVLSELRQLRAEVRAPLKRLLTVEEAAHYLAISPKSIRNRLGPKAAKPFPIRPVRVSGRVLFRKDDLDAFIDGLGVAE
jgi:predicted DNA-binding transcriptional regulator AlpA